MTRPPHERAGDPPSISFVVPAYRSERSLPLVLDEILAEFPDGEAVVVVDGSPDAVAARAREYAAADRARRVHVVELRQNRGQHFAILQGFKHARAQLVATIDDDGQNPAADYKALVRALAEEDLDCVYGAFETTRQSAFRRLLSRGNQWLSARFMGNRQRIPLSNVRVLRADLAHGLEDSPTPYPFIDALIFRATKHVGWRPVSHRPRTSGPSSYGLWKLANLAVSHTTIFSTLPLLAIALFAFGAAVLNLAWAAFVCVLALSDDRILTGWPSTMVMIAVMFSVQFVFMGVLSIYIGRLYIGFNSSSAVYHRGPDERSAETS